MGEALQKRKNKPWGWCNDARVVMMAAEFAILDTVTASDVPVATYFNAGPFTNCPLDSAKFCQSSLNSYRWQAGNLLASWLVGTGGHVLKYFGSTDVIFKLTFQIYYEHVKI